MIDAVVLHRVRRAVRAGDRNWIKPEARRVDAIVFCEASDARWRARRNCGIRGRRVMHVALLGLNTYSVKPPGFRSAGSALRAIATGRVGFLGAVPQASAWSGGSHARAVWRDWFAPSEMQFRRARNHARMARRT